MRPRRFFNRRRECGLRGRGRCRGSHGRRGSNPDRRVVEIDHIAAVMPDFGMNGEEINPVVRTMRKMGWDIGCLYNQETEEHPQLCFSHELKVGNPYKLAAQVRKGLDQMKVQ
jgi:Domain of Unknown Function (DUF1259)